MADSHQQKLTRVRPGRVILTYDVEVGGATVKRELPFVVGVMGDFSGHPTKDIPKMKDRKFVKIDRDNFNEVMSKMNAGLNIRVPNKLQDDDSELSVELSFNSMDDFDPGRIVQQVEPLRKLMEQRNRIKQLQSEADRSDDLEAELEKLLSATESQGKDGEQ